MNGGMDRGRALAAMDAELLARGECVAAECGEDELRGLGEWQRGGGDAHERVVERGGLWRDGDEETTGCADGDGAVMSYQEAGEL